MADRPVDDILADLLALEEEVSAAPQTTGGTQSWNPDALLADPTAAASVVPDAAGSALLADCDALLADVDLLLSDSAGTTPHAAAGTAASGRSGPAQTSTRRAAAATSSTAAVLSECDVLLADADMLLADEPGDPFVGVAAPLQATQAAAAPSAAFTASAATAGHSDAPAVQHNVVAAASGCASAEAGGAAASSLLDADTTPVAAALESATPSTAPSAGATQQAAGATGAAVVAPLPPASGAQATAQHTDVDLLLQDLLTSQDNAAPVPAAATAIVADPASQPAAGYGNSVAAIAGIAADDVTAAQEPPPPPPPLQQQQHEHRRNRDAVLLVPSVPQQQQQQQQQQELGEQVDPGSVSNSSEDSSEDFLGDMLHDMAEVLEVDEGALTGPPLHGMQAPAAAAEAAVQPSVLPAAVAGRTVSPQADSSNAMQQQQWGLPGLASSSTLPGSLSNGDAVTWQTLSGAAPSSTGQLPPHELALQQAWAQEEALVHGDLTDSPPASPTAAAGVAGGGVSQQEQQQRQRKMRRRLAPLPRLQELLSDALADWNPAGRPDASGTAMIGGSVLLCLESLAGLFATGAAASGAAAGVDWAHVLSAALAPHGQLQVVAASGQYLAVGAASGSTLVFQLPVPQTSSSQGSGSAPQNPSHSMGSGHSPLPGGAAMWQLGGHSGGHSAGALGPDPVSSLGFSVVGAAGDALWLAVGHVSGSLTVWELQKRGPRQIASIAQHSSRLTFTTFMPGRATSLLLSGDVRGRCCLHTFSASLLRTNVASRVLISGEYGPLLSIAHLAPFAVRPSGLPAGAVRGTGGGGEGVEWPDAGAWKMLCEDGAWRVGEGVCCLTTPTNTYIARIKPSSGDLVMLFSIPQPNPGAQQQAVPVAAWLPHSRQKAGGHSQLSGDMLMPVGVLALGWGSRLVLFEVPLVGEQITAGELAAVAVTANQAAAAAQQAKRTNQPAAVAAAAASRLWHQRSQAALDSLSPEVAITVATQFPLSTCASWTGGQQQHGGQGSAQASAGGLVQLDLQQHQLQMGPAEPLPVLGVHWLDADAVAVVCNQGYSSLLLVLGLSSSSEAGSSQQHAAVSGHASLRVYEQVEWMDQPVDRAWGSPGGGAGGLTAWGADCGGSVVGSGARMYLLGQQGGLFCGRLMPWSERLKTLQDVCKYKLGLYFALRFYLTMQQQGQVAAVQQPAQQRHGKSSSSSGGPAPRQSVGGFARSEGIGAEPQQLEQWLLSLVLGHASATLSDVAASATVSAARDGSANGAATDGSLPQAVVAAAEACVCACLLLSRTDVLFGRVFQLFAQQGLLPGALGALVETVELAVLSDLLQGLAPEVMQALVEHFARKGQPGRVEACVVHLPIMSLDLNQVIRLCEDTGLYSALTHIYNQMNDFRKPLLDLLANVAAAPNWQVAQATGYKLLVYLRCCFRGMAFPPGTGDLPTDPPGVRDVIQATLLGSLLFLDRTDLLREWQSSGGAAAAVAAAAAGAGSGHAAAGPVLPALCDPHPALQLLLAVDVPATITVLAEATSGWDAVETDLRAAAGKPTAELESVLVATQVVVNALVALLEAGRFQQWQAHRPTTSTDGSSSASPQPTGAEVAMSYIIQLLAAGRVNAKPSFVIKLLQHLVAQAAAAAAVAGDALQVEATEQKQSEAPPAVAPAAFEQQFVSIVQVVGVQAAGSGMQQQGQPTPADVSAFSPAQAKELLQLAKRCNFVCAAATVHHLQGNYAAALSCYLALTDQQHIISKGHSQQQQQQQPPAQGTDTKQGRQAVFDYINGFLSGGGSTPGARKAFLACVCQQVVQLIQLDPSATAAVLLQHMPEQQVPVLLSLQANPELQFQFLRAAMQQNQLAERQSGPGSPAAASAPATGTAAAAAGAESLLERPEVAILYVKLLARFEPSAVLPFLQSHHNYSVAEAIKVCRTAGVHDAEAFLHERLGDLDAALQLYLSSAQQANSALQAAVLAGSVPLLLLPPGYWVPGWFDRRRTAQAHANGSSSSSCRDQPCFGMEQLVQQLESVAQMVSGVSTGGQDPAAAAPAVPGDISQASDQLTVAAANVAATLLHQLDPAAAVTAGSSRAPDRAPAPLGSSLRGSLDEACSSAAAALLLPPPFIDLYKSWMAQLSPRLRLKGLGAGAGTTVMQQTGLKAAGGSSASGAQAGVRIPAVPAELQTAWQALQAAVAFCQRNTRPGGGSTAVAAGGGGSSSSSAAAGGGQKLWFGLMDVYVGNLRGLHATAQQAQHSQQHQGKSLQHTQQQQDTQQNHGSPQEQQQQQRLVADLKRAVSRQAPLRDLPAVLRSARAAVAAQQLLPGLLRLLLDEVVCSMADHLPLLDIVGRIIQQHGNERFGEFKSTLLGLFGATGYDSAIMAAANRLITGDAFTAVRHAYGLRQLARALQEQQQQQDAGGALTATSSSSSASMLQAAPAAAAAAAPAAAVQSAMLLGVLGPSSYDSSSIKLSGSRYSLTQADRDLIQGILGTGGMRLQLQPAGPLSAPGVAAAYKAAAQAVADTGRMFQGEMDLALELAMLQSLQEHQQHQRRQQQGTAGDHKGWAGGWGGQGSTAEGVSEQHDEGGGGRVARAPASTSSFDIDELLTWSATNM